MSFDKRILDEITKELSSMERDKFLKLLEKERKGKFARLLEFAGFDFSVTPSKRKKSNGN